MRPGKRLFDLFFSVTGSVVLLVPLALVGVAIKLADRGPLFFRQQRVGYRGELFWVWKFRTMRENAASEGPSITVGADPRITPVGAVLRRLKIDEFPQLINVIRGEMSLVGPRPEVPEYVALYTDEQRAVLELMPGITDPASVKYRDEAAVLARSDDPQQTYVDEVMPDKIRINLEYARRATMWSDFGVVLKTVLPFL